MNLSQSIEIAGECVLVPHILQIGEFEEFFTPTENKKMIRTIIKINKKSVVVKKDHYKDNVLYRTSVVNRKIKIRTKRTLSLISGRENNQIGDEYHH